MSAMMTYEVELDMTPGGVTPELNASQYDSDFEIKATLIATRGNLTIPSGASVRIRGTKPDGNGYSADGELVDNVATFEGDIQMTAASGKVVFEVTLMNGSKELNTKNFVLNVERAALDETTVASDSKVAELYAVEDNAEEIIAAGAQYAAYKEALDQTAADAAESARQANESASSAAGTLSDFNTAYAHDKQEFDTAYENAMRQINDKSEAIAQLTTDAGTIARQALDMATLASNETAEFSTQVEAMKRRQTNMQLLLDEAFDGAYVEDGSKLYFTHQGEVVAGPFTIAGSGGGGGGSSSGNNAVITVSNTSGWQAKTFADGGECITRVTWSSIEEENPTGPGTMHITVNGVTKAVLNVQQGEVAVDIADFLSVGANVVKETVYDTYGNNRTINFSVEKVAISIASTFDSSTAYQGAISFPYTPTGSVQKTVHFILDGTEIDTTVTSVSGRQMSFTIPQQSHGAHTFECYFDAVINGQTVESNRLYFEIICLETLNTTPIIVSDFNRTEAAQYETLLIDYKVYDPIRMEAPVTISVNGDQVQELTVDRTAHTFSYRADNYGALTVTIESGTETKTFRLTIEESDEHPEAVTDRLVLHLSAAGRSNSENNPAVWEYGEGAGKVSVQFHDFNWARDGWVIDDDGQTCLRTMGGSGITIPFEVFGSDFLSSGKTIEIEFATHDVLDYDAPIISCMSGDRGFRVTADQTVFKSARSEISAKYSTDTHLRLTLTVQPQSKNRLEYLYIDGEYARIVQYPQTDSFRQADAVGITIGHASCGVDIYAIRVYDRDLTGDEVLGNFIADRQDVGEMLSLYRANNIKDEYGNIVIDKLSASLPYVVFTGLESPQFKGDKKTVTFDYVEPTNIARRFAATGVQVDVQGTSSQYYAVKNLKVKFKNGGTLNGTLVVGFSIREGSIVVDTVTLKADVASSESANNIVLAKLFDDLSRSLGILTPPQRNNAKIRQGMDGFPCVVFWDYGDGPEFIGKYNFNNDKGNFNVFGFAEGDESWDVRSNTSQLTKFHSAEFTGDWATEDLESIYPEDYTDDSLIRPMTEFIYSTWQDAATGETLAEPVTYGGVEYTADTAAYRLAKFKDGYPDLYDLDNAAFYYVFTLVLLMVDSRQKNEHITYWSALQKWWELIYDCDTALGNDNRGNLTFEYWMEDIDRDPASGDWVFNGADNVKWENFRQAFWNEAKSMYQRMRSSGLFSAPYLKQLFHDWQSAWAKAIWNEDGKFKYVGPLEKDGTTTYLSMAFGSKGWQRDEFLDWRFAYCDSLFDVAEALLSITFRPYYEVTEEQRAAGDVDIVVDIYKKGYVTVLWDDNKTSQRVIGNSLSCTVHNPLRFANDAVCGIHNAKMIKDIHGLENLFVGFWDSTNAPNLQALRLGSNASGYENRATKTVSVGANHKLTLVDMRNCVNFGTDDQKTLTLSQCPNIREVYLDGTACMGVDLPNGGVLETLHLPSAVTSIVLRNHPKLDDEGLVVASYANVDQLWLENMTGLDTKAVLQEVPAGTAVRITGFYWECEDSNEIDALFDLFDTMHGLDINSEEVSTAQLSGTIHTAALTGNQVAGYNARYPHITISADHVASYLYYKTWDGSETLKTVTCIDGVPQDTTPPTGPARAATDRFRYTFVGWNTTQDASTDESGYLDDVIADRTVYAAYSRVALTYLTYKSYDGETTYKTVTCASGTPEEGAPSNPSRSATAQYTYTFVGWSTSQDAQSATSGYNTNVTSDRIVYAAFSRTVNTYTVTWKDADGTVLETDTGVQYGATPSYNGTTPSYNGQTFQRWTPAVSAVTGNVTYTASYIPEYTVYFYNDSTLLQTSTVQQGGSATYTGAEPTKTGVENPEDYAFTGWSPAPTNIQANTSCYAQFSFSGVVNTISDDLATLMSNCDAGNVSGYSIGDTKKFSMGTMGNMSIQLIAKSADPLADGSGNANTTWLMYYQLPTNHRMNPANNNNAEGTGTIGGWDKSEMKQYILETIVPNLPAEIRNNVKTVKKYTRIFNTSATAVNDVETSETFWLPSRHEMFDGTTQYYETQGPRYSEAFPDNASRVKSKVGASSASWWWLRSASNSTGFTSVYSDGSISGTNAYLEGGVVVGFCI